MAFRFGDPGGRMYTNVGTSSANLLAHWTGSVGAVAAWSVFAGGGRITGSCLRYGAGGNNGLYKTLDNQATWGVAFGFKFATTLSGTVLARILTFTDTLNTQVQLGIRSDNTLQVLRGSTPLGTSSVALSSGVWYHIEFKAKIDPSVGTIEVRLNGVSVIGPLTGQNTRSTANSYANNILLAGTGDPGFTGQNFDYDDIIVWDATTTDQAGNSDIHDFISDCSLTWLLPSGAGSTTQWTPDTGSNYARVNEVTPDGDTSYVLSSTVGNIDTYAMADLPVSVTAVKSAAAVHYSRKDNTGLRGVASELRTGGTNYASNVVNALGTNYQYGWGGSWGTNPNTGVAWTPSDINAIEVGQQVNS